MWALGVLLYEICCLRYPFPADEMLELESKVCNDEVAKPPFGVHPPFVRLFTKMLKKDHTKRPDIEEIIYSNEFQ